jgi:hypothetical protein
MLAMAITITMIMASCAVFIYEDDASHDDKKDSDTLIIITHESLSPLGP